ncbi:hypothetical protein QR680_002144 [Steinernema hermaphroditum]|uniref:RRM domain-containing protein n=1 Tax=Steinernema hermaphroditum TaxID=289476 RepID=A0AA39LHJ7_9BILA|nr:hypothetical protein QR680_002144 [Steinernema hermaphroditum]
MHAGTFRITTVPHSPTFSKKVFLGGLPPDIDERQLTHCFSVFGKHLIDWPHKNDSCYQFPPQGYAFVIFEKTSSVVSLLSQCAHVGGKFIITLSSLSVRNKQVQVRPWMLSDCFYIYAPAPPPNYRLTVFVGGVPRPTTAAQLAALLQTNFGCVLQVTIDVDSSLLYPRGSARVRFAFLHSYMAAVGKRFLRFDNSEHQKNMEIKPFVVDDAKCDKCGSDEAKFCGSSKCLSYYCTACWEEAHESDMHEPVVVGPKRSRRTRKQQIPPHQFVRAVCNPVRTVTSERALLEILASIHIVCSCLVW